MKRRSFLGLLAALPVVGKLAARDAEPTGLPPPRVGAWDEGTRQVGYQPCAVAPPDDFVAGWYFDARGTAYLSDKHGNVLQTVRDYSINDVFEITFDGDQVRGRVTRS